MTGKTLFPVAAGIMLAIVLNSCKDDLGNIDCSSISSSYSTAIKPLIDANCTTAGCHNAGSTRGDFTVYSGLKAVADAGTLEEKVINEKSMPPSGALSVDDRKKIKCWLEAGAPNN